MSEDEVSTDLVPQRDDHDANGTIHFVKLSGHETAPREATPQSHSPAMSVKGTTRSDDEDFKAVAGPSSNHEAPGISNLQ